VAATSRLPEAIEPAPAEGPIDEGCLAREMAGAETVARHYAHWAQPDLAERWSEYRERAAYWRYLLLRGARVTPRLRGCRHCGRVVQGPQLCGMCERWP
jgi:hypothetical protein